MNWYSEFIWGLGWRNLIQLHLLIILICSDVWVIINRVQRANFFDYLLPLTNRSCSNRNEVFVLWLTAFTFYWLYKLIEINSRHIPGFRTEWMDDVKYWEQPSPSFRLPSFSSHHHQHRHSEEEAELTNFSLSLFAWWTSFVAHPIKLLVGDVLCRCPIYMFQSM